MTTPTTPQQGASGFGDVLVSARSLAEYRAMFALTDADLTGTVLDCPGGAASFTAEARGQDVDVVAVDPTYPPDGTPSERSRALRQLGEHAAAEAERGSAWARDHAADFEWTYFATPADHLAQRLAAAAAFTDHAAVQPEHYVRAALPQLPFADGAFDLVLCSHLLFSYADRLDDAFHLAALTELLRVSRGEVRVFPLVVVGGVREHPGLEALLERLGDDVVVDLRATDGYGFQCGADRVLVLRRAQPADDGRARPVATDVFIAEAFPGDPMGGNSKKIWARKPGRGGRRGPGVIDALYDVHGVLDEFISRDTTVRRLPVLARWNEFRDHYHRRGELEALLEEVEQARTWTAASREAGTEVALVLERLQALVRRALDEDLVLAVLVD